MNCSKRRMIMPKYEVTRSYLVSQVAVLEAENANQARIIAMNFDGYWKEYDGDYLTDNITVEEIPDE
tara:strand:- start:449 stop:649 length:201 start_codon:yes stop_codon:yes gene_type:complete